MKFIFKEVAPNNEKQVAAFRSEDQSCELYIAANKSVDFSQFKAGQLYTITEVTPVDPPTPEEKV